MKRPLLILAVLLGFATPAVAQDRALPPGEIRANGDITFGSALKLGKREGNRTVITPDTLQILGSGSTGDASAMSVTPPVAGGIPLALRKKLGEQISVQDTGADSAGASDSTAAFRAAVNSVPSGNAITISVPSGTWNLNEDVSDNGRVVNWQVAPGAVFTGPGKLAPYTIPQFGAYDKRRALSWRQRGSEAAPVPDETPVDAAVKHSSVSALTGSHNTARLSVFYKHSSAATAYGQGSMSLGIDPVGGDKSFVEGSRSMGLITGGKDGGGYGAISAAYANAGTNPRFLIAHEADVLRSEGVSAPPPDAFDKNRFATSFLATTLYTGDKPDAGFLVNPYNLVPFRAGFLVAENSVDHTAFANRATNLSMFAANFGSAYYGLYTGQTTGAAIMMLNGGNSVVRAKSADGSADHNILYYSDSNKLVLGTDASGVVVGAAPKTPASATAACTQGEQAWDASYFYVCVGQNTWKRAALTSW